MKDMLTIVYEQLIENAVIQRCCGDRIKYYDYPEGANTNKTFMIITPLDVPANAVYASDKFLACEFFYQIDVQSKNRLTCKEVQLEVKKEMHKLGFKQQRSGLDDFFPETGRFIDARRYKGISKLYDTDY